MVSTLPTPKSLVMDTWVAATWEEFLAASADSEVEQLRCYYDTGWMRIESMGVGSGHSQDKPVRHRGPLCRKAAMARVCGGLWCY
jgi:hypothetical protein